MNRISKWPWIGDMGFALALMLGIASNAEEPIGWRGDGTGRFPSAEPPITWGRAAKATEGLRFQAAKPEGTESAGKPMPDGVVREWLILGPVPVPDLPKPVDKDTIPDELLLAPNAGDKVETLVWKKINASVATLDFTALLGHNAKSFAYAATNIFSDNGGQFVLQLTHRQSARVVLNAKQIYAGMEAGGARINLPLIKGWNRLLLKIGSDDAQWWTSPLIHAHIPGGYDENGIAWMTPLPGWKVYQGTPAGPGGPIVVGEKIFVLCEPHDLLCLNKSDGKILWARSNSYFDALTDAEKQAEPAYKDVEPIAAKWDASNAELAGTAKPKTSQEARDKIEKELYDAMKRIGGSRFLRPTSQDVGYAGFTPVSDGKLVWVWFASGVTACYDLDGNRKWIRVDNHETVEHGYSSSPILVDGKLIVFMRELMAFDAKTGAEVWRNPIVGPKGMNPGGYFHGSFAHAKIGDVETIVLSSGVIVNAADGKILYSHPKVATTQKVASPVRDNDLVVIMSTFGDTLFVLRLPKETGDKMAAELVSETKILTNQFPFYYLNWHTASPVVHEGLVYLMNNSGVLTVIDEKNGGVVYQRMLDLDHFESANEGPARGHGISPALAGKHLYFFGDAGAAVVIEPGREFKQVAKNKIEGLAAPGSWGERQDRSVACPFFDGKRIYYRTEMGLYALGK